MMRRTIAASEKLVIVESPNKVIKIEGLLSNPNVIPDWSFNQQHLRRVGIGAEKAVAMATTGHFMALKEICWKPCSIPALEAGRTLHGDDGESFPSNGTLSEYTLEWQMLPGRRLQETLERYMQEKLNNVTEIILATDPDREGELIAVHALQTIKRLHPRIKVPYSRAYMHSITEDGIRKAMRERLVDVCDYDLANAAETRHAMDRIFGFLGSSVVRAANAQMRSIGRVQTPALILINEREEKISAFMKHNKTTFIIEAMCQFPAAQNTTFTQVVSIRSECKGGDALQWSTEAEVQQCIQRWMLDRCTRFTVPHDPVITQSEVSQPMPFTMATAIAKANRQLKMSSETVSSCLQDLFQQGHITYPRTDSTRIDDGALSAIYNEIENNFGKEFLYRIEDRVATAAEGKKTKKSRKKKATKTINEVERLPGNVEDAHEAIRPTNIHADGDSLSLPPQTRAVYDLVRRNTLAAFMIPMKTEKIAVTVKFLSGSGENLLLVLDGKRTVESGWTRAFCKADATSFTPAADGGDAAGDMTENEDGGSGARPLRSLSQEEFVAIANLRAALASPKLSQLLEVRSFTARENRPVPPLPHSEGTLIEELKNNGVGRPSTYPMIVKTLLTRGYIQVNSKGRCETTPVGRLLVSTAKSTFPSIVDIGFTASFEKKLDLIAKPNSTRLSSNIRGKSVSRADYVLSMFLSTFLNYVADATRMQRARIVERSLRLKHGLVEGLSEKDEAAFEESVANAKKNVALATGDLAMLPKTHHNFTALQRGLHDYLRRHFPPAQLSSTGAVVPKDGDSNVTPGDDSQMRTTAAVGSRGKWEKRRVARH